MGRRIHLANGSGYGATDLVELFNHDGRGNTASEKYFGGDGQSLPATSPAGYICNLASTLTSPAYKIDHTYSYGARATSSYTVGSNTLYLLKQTIDRSTGLPLTSQDTADQQTSYAFDSMGRITTVTPPQGAVTSYTYRRATVASSLAQVTVSVNLNNVNYGESRIGFDGFGRPVTEEERMPNALRESLS
jgi:YD repeat-containing protein